MCWYTCNHLPRGRSEPVRPILPDKIMIRADTTTCNSYHFCHVCKFSCYFSGTCLPALCIAWSEQRSVHTSDGALMCYKPIYTVTRLIGDKPIFYVFSNSIFKRRNNTRTGSPYNMESGNGIPVSFSKITASFSPSDYRKKTNSHFM